MPATQEQIQAILEAYRAFNAREIDAALAVMTPDVDWPNGQDGGCVRGHDEVRAYWTRQWTTIDPLVRPLAIDEEPDGRLVVTVLQVIRGLDGEILHERQLEHIYTLQGTLVSHMEIKEIPQPAG